MTNVNLIDPAAATGTVADQLGQIKAALNLFTNYVNVALDVPVDFPGVQLTRAA